jgi:type IV pilus assembly protein PilY1
MKKATALILSLSLVFANLPLALADDSDIFGVNIQPNVLILLDSSQSMGDDVGTFIPYDPNNNTYPVVYTAVTVYKFANNRYTVYAANIAAVSSASARTALSTVGYWTGTISGSTVHLYVGNYLNYQACGSCDGLEPKITVAKRVISNLISSTEGVRFGVMKFADHGAAMVAPIGSDTTTLVNAINNMSLTSVGTPLGDQLYDAGRYYKGTFPGYATPIQFACQTNFAIVVTDGLENSTTRLLVNEATNRRTQDHSPAPGGFSGLQNVIVDTIGFGISVSESGNVIAANGILQQAAANGGGYFYSTDNSGQAASLALENYLQDAIRRIMAATFSFATPAIPTTSTTGDTRIYVAALQSDISRPFWRGFLRAYQRDANGNVPVDANGIPLASAQAWEAGDVLSHTSAASRTIYTTVNGARQLLTTTNPAITPAHLGVSTDTEKNQLINFIRGVDSYDENQNGNTTEERAWKLGDIFHSNPVVVTRPFQVSTDSTYNAFKAANASRPGVVLVGANDGLLHAFRESDGTELWAFIPRNFRNALTALTPLVGPHVYYVDSSPIVADVKTGGAWKTIVVFGERRGGANYYALDITDTTDPLYLWSFTDTTIAETWSEPAIGKVKMADGTEKYVAFMGGGFDTTANNTHGKIFFAVDLANGQKLWQYYNNSSSNDRQYMNFSLAGNPTAVDLDNDGFIDHVYIGDVGGQLWKFDVSGGLVNNWTGKRLFAASPSQTNPPPAGEYYPAQGIFGPPDLAYDSQGNLWVYFGTGDRNHPNNSSSNRFYAIMDNTDMTNGSALTESSLVNVTSTNATPTQGWFFTLGADEKVWTAPDVFNKVVLFSSFTPVGDPCGAGGNAKLYEVQMATGYAALDWNTGLPLSSSNSSQTRAKLIGTGIPSRPITEVSDSGGTVTTNAITGTTSQQLPSNPAPPPTSMRQFLYWTEKF